MVNLFSQCTIYGCLTIQNFKWSSEPHRQNQMISTLGFALDCIVCNGTNSTSIEATGICGKDEEGTSITCPDSATGAAIACTKSDCTQDDETMIIRACVYPIPPPKTGAAPKTNECQDHVS